MQRECFYRVDMNLSLDPIRKKLNPVHILTEYFQFINILLSMPISPRWSRLIWFSDNFGFFETNTRVPYRGVTLRSPQIVQSVSFSQ